MAPGKQSKEKRQGQIDTSKPKSVEKKSYVDGLTGKTRERYLEKLNLTDGVDPYEIDHRSWKYDLSSHPAITYPDLVFYLSNTPSPYTLEDFKAYRSLEAFNQLLSGWVKEIRVMEIGDNRAVSARGHPRLVRAIADLYSPLFKREINPLTQVIATVGASEAIYCALMSMVNPGEEVLTTVGAYEALYCTILSMVNPGDEVILIEPYFDCYSPMVKMAGGKPVCIPLRAKPGAKSSADLYLDKKELEGAFNDNTKAIIVNTPHNPTGKMFSREEIEFIGDLCKKFSCLYISDEVYEWLVYEGHEHVRAATLPGMWDRTVTVCSAGKTFSITGWKIGWAIAPDALIKNVSAIHAQSIYTIATPLQEALAEGLEYETKLIGTEKSYWKWLTDTLEAKKAKTVKMAESAGMTPIVPEGGYFMMADISSFGLELEDDGRGKSYDYRFALWLLKEKGLAVIPASPFYSDAHKDLGSKYIRFCFIKEDSTLEKAAEILGKLKTSK